LFIGPQDQPLQTFYQRGYHTVRKHYYRLEDKLGSAIVANRRPRSRE